MQLSDYSFLGICMYMLTNIKSDNIERSVHDIYIWIWFIVHVWRCDRFASLSWKRISSLELKSFVTLFILIALPLGSFYDIVSTKITYIEGFYKFQNNAIRGKPRYLWSEDDKLWFIPSYYIFMTGLSFQTVTLFLLQCFWNYLTNSIAQTSFISRGEFAVYIVWGIISVSIYPILPYVFSKNEILLEAIPQLVYATQLLILVLLGIRTHLKFLELIKLTSSYKNSANIIAKIRYFIDMNKLLTISLIVTTVSYYLLSIDLLTSAKIINNSKVASDLLAAHVNFASVIEWLALILIFYPRKGFVGTGAGGSTFNTNLGSSSVNPSVNPVSQISYSNSTKLSNVPPGTGAGINFNNENRQKTNSIVDVNQANNNYQNTIKTKSITASPIPSSDNNSDISNSENNDGNNKPVYLKRNISISKDGKMVYGETKPLGKVKGAEFVAVEKADPSFIPNYYFSNELKDRNGNLAKKINCSSRSWRRKCRYMCIPTQVDDINVEITDLQ
ncbi:14108_t:CDS:2 [Rhizophagus irregularis]|nr:14108_t:CDS:2 [Rhizophagus irregularis]